MCHQTFTNSAFDRHRTIRNGIDTCHPPAERGLVGREQPWGVLWGLPGGYWNDDSDPET